MRIDFSLASNLLKEADHILILCHRSPDGDTLGSAYALCRALQSLGKKARISVEDEIPASFDYMKDDIDEMKFEPSFFVAVDVATFQLLGSEEYRAAFQNRIDLCIDHHSTNSDYAKYTLLEPEAAATTETILLLLYEMGVNVDSATAECIYTGLSTDTGCFRYSNTTSRTLRMAADMVDKKIPFDIINKRMFETRTATYNRLETLALNSMESFFDGKAAIITITQEMYRQSGSDESESHPLKAIPRQIEGVLVGVTIKEMKDGSFQASVRTDPPANASRICTDFGGGGHIRAAGCNLPGQTIEEAKENLLKSIKAELERL